MQIVDILSMHKEVQHVVPLTTNLKASLNPVKLGRLKKLCLFERPEQIFFVQRFRTPLFQLVLHVAFEELLVGHTDLGFLF